MDSIIKPENENAIPEFLSGGGEMGKLIRSIDWSKTPLGSPDTWPQSLRTTVSLCIASNFPISIAWGPHRVQIYNEGYWPITGDMHPMSMGQDFKECWLSAWPVIGQAFEEASLGQTRFLENQRIFLDRYGYIEETFFTFSFSPILDETGGVGGLFHPVIELTQQTLAERRLNILRAVPDNTVNAKTAAEASALLLECLKDFELDLPFVLLYSITDDGKEANLEGSVGVEADSPIAPANINLQETQSNSWPFAEVINKGKAVKVEELGKIFGNFNCGPYAEPPRQALVFTITLHGTVHNKYLLVTGVSSRRSLDEKYLLFFDLLTASITNALAKARSYEEERKKSEALAEIDKAKTVFFSNISHEFRTPLTLMLGSLEELLNKRNSEIAPTDKEAIETSHRNAMRLLRLVNNLLDFSRIEAGRVQAQYQLTDVAKYTIELASNFRSVIENAGLIFEVKTDADIHPVYIDKEMWEKIVLNLLSNAFKYTLNGSISVTLDNAPLSSGERFGVRLKIKDTGVGIPENELPKMFQRFHRIQNVIGRTYEGTGIGLSLVSELVKLHGGEISVESKEAEGSVFTVSIPAGKSHLPTAHIFDKEIDFTSLADAFIDEATTLIEQPFHTGNGTKVLEVLSDAETVLVVDDNADMRAYIKNLLQNRYHVITANNGIDALQQVKEHVPQLIVSDIMMPVMDGIGLLKAIKENVQTHNIPVILLSARAGEEAKIEGFETGADDYLIKPFSSKELLARVASQLKLVKLRQATETNVRNLFIHAPAVICVLRGPQHIYELANAKYLQLIGNRDVIGKPIRKALPELDGTGIFEILDDVYKTGKPFTANEMPVTLQQANGVLEERILNFIYQASRNEANEIDGILVYAVNVTEQVLARKKIEESEEQLRIAIEGGDFGTYDFYPQTGELKWSQKTKELFGLPQDAEVNYDIYLKGLHPDDRERSHETIQKALDPKGGSLYENEYRTIGITDGRLRWIRSKGKVSFDAEGKAVRFTGVTQDITRQKEILASLQLQSLVLERMDEGVSVSDENGIILLTNTAEDEMFGYKAGELIGKHVTVQNAYPKEDNEKMVADVIAELKNKGFWSGEWHNRKKDGTCFHTHSFITSLVVDGKTLFVCVQRDITEEKAASEKLAYRTALLEAQNEAIPDAILIVDTKGKMLSFNQHFVDLWKIPREIIKRKDDSAALQFAMTQLTDPQGFFERVHYCYAHPEQKAYDEVLFKDGRIIERYGNVVVSEDGRSYGWAWYFRDITERKLGEEKLKESEERFRSLGNSIPQLAWMADSEGYIHWYNQRWYDYTGTTLEEMKGWGWKAVHHPDLVDGVEKDFKNAIAKGEPYDDTFLLLSKEGKYHWFLTRAVPLRNANGEILQWFGTNTDVSHQREVEEALKEVKEQLELTFQNVPSAIYHFDKSGKILYLNEKGARQMGYATVEDVLAEKDVFNFRKKLDEIFTVLDEKGKPLPTDESSAALTFKTGKASEVVSQFINKKTGASFWLLSKSAPLYDEKGELSIVLTTSTDISLQKNSEQAIRQSEEELRTLSEQLELKVKERTGELATLNKTLLIQNETFKQAEESSGQGSYSFNLTTGILAYSDNLYRLLGYEPGEFSPVLEEFYKHVHPEDLDIVKKGAEKVLKTIQADDWMYRMVKKNGQVIQIKGTGRIITSNTEKLLVGTLQDITDDVLLKQMLQTKNLELERSNEDLQQFAHVASHDLKEPVRKIKTFSYRLQDEMSDLLTEKGKIYLLKVHSAVDRMLTMIDGVLAYSTINASEQLIERVNLTEIFKDIETDMEVTIHQKSAVIEYGNLPTIEGAPVLIYQLFSNLINNSLKFSKAVTPPIINITSEIIYQNGNEMARILVKDNGVGFEQDQAQKIFDTFTRLYPKDQYEGTGLGLAQCKKIVARHKGFIEASGQLNEGAIFTITIPVKQFQNSL